MDVSLSMLANDINPTRLERAKRKALKLTEKLEKNKNNHRVGIVLFAGSSYLYVPLTEDYDILRNFIKEIRPELIESQGSALSDAIRTSAKALFAGGSKAARIVLFSDGEDNKIEIAEAITILKDNKLVLHLSLIHI